MLATGLSLVGYTLFPAPAGLAGSARRSHANTHVNLSSDLARSLYDPFAASPVMHFG